jgi:hypothetical protein
MTASDCRGSSAVACKATDSPQLLVLVRQCNSAYFNRCCACRLAAAVGAGTAMQLCLLQPLQCQPTRRSCWYGSTRQCDSAHLYFNRYFANRNKLGQKKTVKDQTLVESNSGTAASGQEMELVLHFLIGRATHSANIGRATHSANIGRAMHSANFL